MHDNNKFTFIIEEIVYYVFTPTVNKGVVTINLPDVALTSKETGRDFWELLDERLELCHKAHKQRIEKRLFGTKSDVSPVHWQFGAIARLKPGETIDKYLTGGYSTTSLGYVGLYETVMALKGVPHTDPSAKDFALSIVKHMVDKCEEWNKQDDYGYSVYGTPEESTTFDFAKALQRRHGIIKGITDKDYVVNSYHCNLKEKIDAISKLEFEAPFQKYTTGGAVSYFECSRNIINNMKAFHKVIEAGYKHIMYFEANTKPDYCYICKNFDHIDMARDPVTNKRIWKCSCCGNTDLHQMDVSRRVCGYPGTVNYMNQGRMGDIGDRVEHI